MSENAPKRVKLSDVCMSPELYGVCAIEPNPRKNAPPGPFKVDWTDVDTNTEQRTGQFTRNPDDHESEGYTLERNDLLLHIESGVVARVIHREPDGKHTFEGWVPPQSEEDTSKWLSTKGTGTWVVWGRCFNNYEELPMYLKASIEDLDAKDSMEAFGDMYPAAMDKMRDPNRPQFAATHWKKLPKKVRAKWKRKFRNMLGTMQQSNKMGLQGDQMDDWIHKNAKILYHKKTKEGGEITKFIPPSTEVKE